MPLAETIENEMADLAARYGAPLRATVELESGAFSPFTKGDRLGEVCMVVRRPTGRLLTARKQFYPPGTHRLLTGGVAHGESIEAALLRETHEETGLNVVVRRFLAVITYHAPPSESQQPGTRPDTEGLSFATFAFLLDETGGTLAPQDEEEQIEEFREVLPADLPAIAALLEQSPDVDDPEIAGNWQAWGHFRAVVHRTVHAVLLEDGLI